MCSFESYVVHFGGHRSVSYWHRAIGSKWDPPRVWLNRSLLEYVEFGALGLVSIISPSSELGIERRFFFLDSLLIEEVSEKI